MATNVLTRELVKTLTAHLKAEMPSIQKAYDEFPNETQRMVLPSASVFLGSPEFTPLSPYQVSKGDVIASGDDAGKTPVRYCMGFYEFRIQVDMWCGSKFERHDIGEEFMLAMNKMDPSPGVTLELEDYYGEFVHFHVEKVPMNFDNEASAQTGEWRVKADVVCSVRRIQESLEFLMETIENTIDATQEEIVD